jgi:hypothetical protein
VGKARIILFFVGITGTAISVATFVVAVSADTGAEDGHNAAQAWAFAGFLGFLIFGSIAAAFGISWYQDRDRY